MAPLKSCHIIDSLISNVSLLLTCRRSRTRSAGVPDTTSWNVLAVHRIHLPWLLLTNGWLVFIGGYENYLYF
jgi:hypothetical protein